MGIVHLIVHSSHRGFLLAHRLLVLVPYDRTAAPVHAPVVGVLLELAPLNCEYSCVLLCIGLVPFTHQLELLLIYEISSYWRPLTG